MSGEPSAVQAVPGGRLAVAVCGRTRLYRDGLADALRRRADVVVVGSAADGEACLGLAGRERPAVVLVDATVVHAAATIRALTRLADPPQVVALAVSDSEESVIECVEAGAAAFVTVEESLDDLVATLASLA